MNTTYEVNVTPSFDGLTPVYKTTLYVNRSAGISGPIVSTTVNSLDAIDEWISEIGFTRTSEFGPVCSNGFVTAEVAR